MMHHYPVHKQTVPWLFQRHLEPNCSFPSSQMPQHCSCLLVEPSPHIFLSDLCHLAVTNQEVDIISFSSMKNVTLVTDSTFVFLDSHLLLDQFCPNFFACNYPLYHYKFYKTTCSTYAFFHT